MISPLVSGMSAISAFTVKMNAIANIIANLNADGFKNSRATLTEGPFGGLGPDVNQVNASSYSRPTAQNSGVWQVDASNVDLAEEFTDSLSTQSGSKANLKTMQAYDEMLGSLLDTIG
jgi:flagellar hook protein FlgE